MTGIRPLVLDFGTGVCKAGFAGTSYPQMVYQSCVQQQEILENGVRQKMSPVFVGNENLSNGELTFPIEHGIVTDWDNAERLWEHAFQGLHAKPEDHIMLVTEAPFNPKVNREKTAEILFEKYKVPALYFANTAKMCAHALDMNTGVVLELGDGVTAAVPIENGNVLTACGGRIDFGGRELTKSLRKLLDVNEQNEWRGFSCEERFSRKNGIRDVVRKAKEQVCYVAKDFRKEVNPCIVPKPCIISVKNSFRMNAVLYIGHEKFSCPEGLFKPCMILASSASGIHQLTVNAIKKCAEDLRGDLYSNIVLCGGTAQLPGLVQRLTKEISYLIKGEAHVDITRSEDLCCAWTGATSFASSAVFRQMCINKDKYEELGKEYLHDMAERKSHLNVQAFQFLQ